MVIQEREKVVEVGKSILTTRMTSSGIPKAIDERRATSRDAESRQYGADENGRERRYNQRASPQPFPRRKDFDVRADDDMESALPTLRETAAQEQGVRWRVGTVVHRVGTQPGWPLDAALKPAYPHLSSSPEPCLGLGFSVGDKVTTPLGRQATIVGTNAEPSARSYTDVHGQRRTHLWAEYLKASEPEASTSSDRLHPEAPSPRVASAQAVDDEAPSPSRWSLEELDALSGNFPLRSHRSLRAMVRLGMPSRGGFFLPGREPLGEPKGSELTSLPYLRLLFTRSEFEDTTRTHDNFRTAEWLRSLPPGAVVWSPTGVQMRIHNGELGHTRSGRLDAKRIWASQMAGRLASTLIPLEEPVIAPGQPHAAQMKKACQFAVVREGRLLKDRVTPMRPNATADRFRDDRNTPAAIATRCGFGMNARGTTANELERVVRPRLDVIRERVRRHELNRRQKRLGRNL